MDHAERDAAADDRADAVAGALWRWPAGHRDGRYGGRRWSATLSASADGRRRWLFAEERGGPGRVSCNLYRLADGRAALRPCEMPLAAVAAFVRGFRAEDHAGERDALPTEK